MPAHCCPRPNGSNSKWEGLLKWCVAASATLSVLPPGCATECTTCFLVAFELYLQTISLCYTAESPSAIIFPGRMLADTSLDSKLLSLPCFLSILLFLPKVKAHKEEEQWRWLDGPGQASPTSLSSEATVLGPNLIQRSIPGVAMPMGSALHSVVGG